MLKSEKPSPKEEDLEKEEVKQLPHTFYGGW